VRYLCSQFFLVLFARLIALVATGHFEEERFEWLESLEALYRHSGHLCCLACCRMVSKTLRCVREKK